MNENTVEGAAPIRPPARSTFIGTWPYTVQRFVRRQPIGAVSAFFLLVIVLMAIFADRIAPFDPNKLDAGPTLSGPSNSNLFGTDQFGRDIFSRVLYGARTSLYVGIGATIIGVFFAMVIGAISGYVGGILDYVAQRFVDAAQAIPPMVLLIGLLSVLGPSVTNVIIALSVRQALSLSRIVRGSVIGIREMPFVDAARIVGASTPRVLVSHIIPNVFPLIIVLISTTISINIIAEATLSFLGLGVPPPNASWGGMMSSEGRIYMLTAPWIMLFPMAALALVVIATNMFGDALRDELDPRMRGSR